eukprot:3671970-Pleurochrysis_carterae.AAC.1
MAAVDVNKVTVVENALVRCDQKELVEPCITACIITTCVRTHFPTGDAYKAVATSSATSTASCHAALSIPLRFSTPIDLRPSG